LIAEDIIKETFEMPGLPAAIMFGNLNMVPFVGFFLPTNGSFGRTEDDAPLVDTETSS
jgi:hypothetical protein